MKKNYSEACGTAAPLKQAARVHVTQKPDGHIFRGSTGRERGSKTFFYARKRKGSLRHRRKTDA